MSDQIKIGNVLFYNNDIKSTSVVYRNGEKINCVWLNNGTRMEFKDQKTDSKASVTIGNDLGNNGKYGTSLYGITGLYLEGTKDSDYYHVAHCEDYNIDVKDGNTDEVRIVKSDKGTVNADISDNVKFIKSDDFINMNEGFFTRTKIKE